MSYSVTPDNVVTAATLRRHTPGPDACLQIIPGLLCMCVYVACAWYVDVVVVVVSSSAIVATLDHV